MTDRNLLTQSLQGDEDAFKQLYDRYIQSIYNFAWVVTRSKDDAEDIVQECFLILIQKGCTFDPDKAQLRTWLLSITRKLCLQRLRRRRGIETLEVEPHSHSTSAEQFLLHDEVAGAVRRAVAALPGSQRQALFLFEFEQLSLKEVATILCIKTNAVKARLFRAREQLKTELASLSSTISTRKD
jgi:RNA polymerase sigma-70 factor (ECF subfamily)